MNLDQLKEWINKFQTTRQHAHTQQQGLQAFLLDLETSKHLVQQSPPISWRQIPGLFVLLFLNLKGPAKQNLCIYKAGIPAGYQGKQNQFSA